MKKQSFRTEREFGLIVGVLFVMLGAWWIYRGKFAGVSHVLLPVGVILVVLGLIVPRALVHPNRGWMKFSEGLAFVMTRVILGIVFFLIVTPIGVIKRSLGWDPLNRRAGRHESYWHAYPARQRDTRHYEKMY